MQLTITDHDRDRALRRYRLMRTAGHAPVVAAGRAVDIFANDVAARLFAGLPDEAERAARRWRAALTYLDSVEGRMGLLPYWQTGKVTFAPSSLTDDDYREQLQTDELMSGVCWTCNATNMTRGWLLEHIMDRHNRRPFASRDDLAAQS